MDVLPFIPKEKHEKVIENTCMLSSKYIIVSWKNHIKEETQDVTRLSLKEKDVIAMFTTYHMHVNVTQTNYFRVICTRKQLDYVFIVFESADVKETLLEVNCGRKSQYCQ